MSTNKVTYLPNAHAKRLHLKQVDTSLSKNYDSDEIDKVTPKGQKKGDAGYEHDPQIEFEQRKLADELGHKQYARREKPLIVQDKKQNSSMGEGNPLSSHPALEESAYFDGVPPFLADVMNSPQVLDQLLQCDPEQMSPELRQQLSQVPGLSSKLENRKNNTPTFKPAGH